MATQNSIDLTQLMYIAYYGRPADPGGLDFWANSFDDSADLSGQLASFGNSEEFTTGFGDLTNTELVNGLYKQLFNRDADQAGLDFYVNLIATGQSTLASIAKDIAVGAQNDDETIITNKTTVANYFTQKVSDTSFEYSQEDIPGARQLLSSVSEDNTTVTAGESWADLFLSNQNITISENGSSDASTGDFIFQFAEGDYSYQIAGIASGDKLSFANDISPTIVNEDGSDGVIQVISASTQGVVEITLTGIASTSDGQIFNLDTFNSVIGANSLAWGRRNLPRLIRFITPGNAAGSRKLLFDVSMLEFGFALNAVPSVRFR